LKLFSDRLSQKIDLPSYWHKGVKNLFTAIDSAEHARYRRILAPGFSQAALDSLENVIMDSGVLALLNKFDAKYCDKKIACNLFTEFGLLSFDVIGELAYGKTFDMIKLDSHPFPGWLKVSVAVLIFVVVMTTGN